MIYAKPSPGGGVGIGSRGAFLGLGGYLYHLQASLMLLTHPPLTANP